MRSSVERYLPVVYLVMSIVLVAALLPTMLRPPQPPPPTSAEFSPDAPPDDNQEFILSELSRGVSTTAGAGEEVGVGAGGGTVRQQVVELVPRRGRCFGDPPRQVESIYAPPCAAAWTGDNGGPTWQGVTANEIRIALFGAQENVGRVPTDPQPDETNQMRTFRVFQQYFNERFELYNRRIQFYVVSAGSGDEDEVERDADYTTGPSATRQRNAVGMADEQFDVFGIVNEGPTYISAEHESLRRKLVHMGRGWQPQDLFVRNAPFAWTFRIDLNLQIGMTAELICKQMGNKPPEFNRQQDPSFDYNAPRRYGLIEYKDHIHYGILELMEEGLSKCGLQLTERHTANFGDNQQAMAGAITKMRVARVTTVIVATDPLAPIIYTTEAQNQNYYPEWVHVGGAGQDLNGSAALYQHRTQWRHAIGIKVTELDSGRASGSDNVRAYKEIDPENSPTGSQAWFWQLMHMVAGIQLAGPNLTPHTFQDGMHRAWPPRPPVPTWTVGGGYRPGKWSYTNYVALQWWDPDSARPGSSLPGAYRHPYRAKRFTTGEIPTEPVPFFVQDPDHITQAPAEDRM